MKLECGKLDIEYFIACSLNLKKNEYSLFEVLLKEKKSITIAEISHRLDLDRTTVQKSLKILIARNIIQRYQKNLAHGGYIFTYIVKDKNNVKKHIQSVLKKWFDNAHNSIESY